MKITAFILGIIGIALVLVGAIISVIAYKNDNAELRVVGTKIAVIGGTVLFVFFVLLIILGVKFLFSVL